MVHAILIHDQHDQIDGLASELKTPASSRNGYRRWRTPPISITVRSPARSNSFSVPTAKTYGDVHHRRNHDDAVCIGQDLGRNALVGRTHNFVEDVSRIMQAFDNIRLRNEPQVRSACGDACVGANSHWYDEASRRYRGLRFGQRVTITDGGTGLLVRPEAARRQIVAETPKETPGSVASAADPAPSGATATGTSSPTTTPVAAPVRPRRFHGTVALDPSRVGRDAGRVADEIVSHLAGLVGSQVEVTLEIHGEVADGVPDKVVRTVTENSRTLKFTDHGFEES